MSPKSEHTPETNFRVDLHLSAPVLEKALSLGRLPAKGALGLSALPRLEHEVLGVDGPVSWAFAPDAKVPGPGRRRRRWWLTVQAGLVCTCERCLTPVHLSLSTRRGFEFCESAAQADAQSLRLEEAELEADPDIELVDYLSPEDEMTIAKLVEDELLLNLPMAPKHDGCKLPAELDGPGDSGDAVSRGLASAPESAEPEVVRPFLGLKDLLKKR